MSWPGAKVRALGALALLALVSLSPIALADHAYSHRYVVVGRVVDSEGYPVQGLTVDLGYVDPFRPEGPCANQPNTEVEAWGPTRTNPVTNAHGEFMFCFHTHAMSRTEPGEGILHVPDLGIERRFEFDGFTRHSFVPIRLDEPHPLANKTMADEHYTVQGRAWMTAGGPTTIEGVRVYGDTVQNAPVEVRLELPGAEPIVVTTRTNGYGDFAVRVPVEARPTSGTVSVTIENRTFSSPVDGQLGATSFRAEFPKESDPFLGKALLGLGIAAAVIVGGGALWYGTNKMREARENRLVMERTERRRANKK